jgi:hypothetical protein
MNIQGVNLQGVNIQDTTTPSGVYTLQLGTKAPVLGAGAQSPFPAAGWTTIASVSADDTFATVSLPFTWNYNGTGYTTFFPNSNYYITFATGSSQFNALAANSPALNKIFFAGADNSWQRVSNIASGTDYLRLRWEGTAATSGTLGSPNMVYELTFFNPALTGGVPWLELLIGLQARSTTTAGIISGIYSTTALLTGGNMGPFPNRGVAANQSYVLVGNSTGTTWTVNTGYYVGGTGY